MENKKITPKKLGKVQWALIILASIAVCVLGYLGLQKYGGQLSEMEIFTQYPERPPTDSPRFSVDSPTDSALISNQLDSVALGDTVLTNIVDNLVAADDKPVVKEEEPKPVPKVIPLGKPTVKKEEETTDSPTTSDLFDELLQGGGQNNGAEFYEKEILSTKTLYKLIVIASKNVLQHQSPELLEIFKTLETEEEVDGILLSDRKGKVVYSTNAKFKNNNIYSAIPELQINDEYINSIEKDGKRITEIPIYATFGRIGTVFIATVE